MMALDDFACNVQAFYSVGIYCALSQPFGIGDFLGFCIKDLYEIPADNLAFLFGIGNASKSQKNFWLASTPMTFSPKHL